MSLLAITAKRFAVSRGCFHTGDSPFAVSHLAGGTAALALRETKIWLVSGFISHPVRCSMSYRKRNKEGLVLK